MKYLVVSLSVQFYASTPQYITIVAPPNWRQNVHQLKLLEVIALKITDISTVLAQKPAVVDLAYIATNEG